jgi:hypothetical protein
MVALPVWFARASGSPKSPQCFRRFVDKRWRGASPVVHTHSDHQEAPACSAPDPSVRWPTRDQLAATTELSAAPTAQPPDPRHLAGEATSLRAGKDATQTWLPVCWHPTLILCRTPPRPAAPEPATVLQRQRLPGDIVITVIKTIEIRIITMNSTT